MNRWTSVELYKHIQEDGATSIHALKVLQFGITERFLIMSRLSDDSGSPSVCCRILNSSGKQRRGGAEGTFWFSKALAFAFPVRNTEFTLPHLVNRTQIYQPDAIKTALLFYSPLVPVDTPSPNTPTLPSTFVSTTHPPPHSSWHPALIPQPHNPGNNSIVLSIWLWKVHLALLLNINVNNFRLNSEFKKKRRLSWIVWLGESCRDCQLPAFLCITPAQMSVSFWLYLCFSDCYGLCDSAVQGDL